MTMPRMYVVCETENFAHISVIQGDYPTAKCFQTFFKHGWRVEMCEFMPNLGETHYMLYAPTSYDRTPLKSIVWEQA